MASYLYNYYTTKAVSELAPPKLAQSEPSAVRDATTIDVGKTSSASAIPAGARFELNGNFYKVIAKGNKSYVLAWGVDEWRLSNVSLPKLKRYGKPLRKAA